MDEPYSKYSLLLDQTARRVKQYAQNHFRKLGFNITVDQWLIIRSLYDHGDLTQSELAELINKDTPTLTRMIDLLVNKQMVSRESYPQDRRCFSVKLTQQGRETVEDMLPKVKEVREKAWEGLDEEDFRQFKRILNTINENLK